jgi:hypothetical protein
MPRHSAGAFLRLFAICWRLLCFAFRSQPFDQRLTPKFLCRRHRDAIEEFHKGR